MIFAYVTISVLWFLGASFFIVYRHETARWPNTIYDSWITVGIGIIVVGGGGAFIWPVTVSVATFIIVIRLGVKAVIRHQKQQN